MMNCPRLKGSIGESVSSYFFTGRSRQYLTNTLASLSVLLLFLSFYFSLAPMQTVSADCDSDATCRHRSGDRPFCDRNQGAGGSCVQCKNNGDCRDNKVCNNKGDCVAQGGGGGAGGNGGGGNGGGTTLPGGGGNSVFTGNDDGYPYNGGFTPAVDTTPCTVDGKQGATTEVGCIPKDPAGFAAVYYKYGLGLIGGISLLFLIFGGYTMLSSQGNPVRLNTGKTFIFYALFGLLLAIFGYVFIEVVAIDILHMPFFTR